jgi:hypothetical protein
MKMNSDLAIKKTKKVLEDLELTPAEKTLLLRLFFRYDTKEFEIKIADLAVEFVMNVNTLISNLNRLKKYGLITSRPVYSDNGAGRCGTAFQLKKF